VSTALIHSEQKFDHNLNHKVAARLAIVVCLSIWAIIGVVSTSAAHDGEDHSKKPAAVAKPTVPLAGKTPTGIASGAATLLDVTEAQRLSDGSLFVPKVVQRQLGIRTLMSELDDLPVAIELNGKVMADPNAGGRVQASQPGRVEASTQGLPNLGQRVTKGQVLAYLRPVMTSLDRGNSLSILADIDSQLAIAERKVQRYEQLAEALPKATVEAARFDYEALQKRKSAVGASLQKTEALLAPVSGIISVANAVAGQVVDAKETLFEIIDPNRLMVEALAYDPLLTADIASASASSSVGAGYSGGGRTDEVAGTGGNNQTLSLSFVGGGQQMREQAIPLLFRVLSPKDAKASTASAPIAVSVGQSVKVIIQTKRRVSGVPVANSAVLKLSGGEMAVWIHTDAERFVQRKVKAQVLDAGRVSLISGVKADERIVILGASLLAQVK
jgi:hypothetical protein